MYLTGVCKSCNLQVPVQRELDLKSLCILTASANSVGVESENKAISAFN